VTDIIPANIEPKAAPKRRISKKLRHAVLLWLTGKAATRKDAAAKANLNETYFNKALKTPAVQVFVREWAERNIDDATLMASKRLGELVRASSEHVSLKCSLRLAENAGLIRPSADSPSGVHVHGDMQAVYAPDIKS
jgi:hypothetical protein